MGNDRRSILRTLWRSLRLRCPVCGISSIIRTPFKIEHHCPSCDALFMREDGFFVGAIMINIVTTELVILLVYLVFIVAIGADYGLVLTILFITALLFPVAFYHHSWSFWLGIDHVIESLPNNVSRGSERRGNDDDWPESIES